MTSTIMRRSAAAAAVLTLSLSLAACGEDEDTAPDGDADAGSSETTPAEEPSMEPSMEPSEEMTEGGMPAGAENVFGPGCSEVPTEGEGSVAGMIDDPVGTAASNNPLLGVLVDAVGVTNLIDTLNDTSAAYTVFAPIDQAFVDLGPTGEELVAGAQDAQDPSTSPLAQILLHHVLPERIEPDMLEGDYDTANGDTITVEGNPEDGMTVSDGMVTANVICGGVPTANATVYVIDMVLAGADVQGG